MTSQVSPASRREPVVRSTTPVRRESAKATRLPTTIASSGVMVNGPHVGACTPSTSANVGKPSSTAMTAATSHCCTRRGGRVSGSVTMKPAMKTIG